MRFDEPSQSFVIDDDFALPAKFFIKEGYSYPSGFLSRDLRQETRVMRCTFENRWSLSIIWGSMTYGSNHDHPWGFNRRGAGPGFRDADEFIEEPTLVEVGIIMPEYHTRPAVQLGDIPGWTGPTEIPAHDYELWGYPLGYVDAPQLRWLVGIVSRFDSHTWAQLEDGPYIEQDDSGRYRLVYTEKEGTGPCQPEPSDTQES